MRILVSFGVLAVLSASVSSVRAEEQKDPIKEYFWYQCYICHVANDPYDRCTPERSHPNAALGSASAGILAMTHKNRGDGLFLRVQNAHGPDLCGVFGAPAGRRSKEGYQHSHPFLEAAPMIVWTEENLDKWLADTRSFIPGTWMFVKIPDPKLRKEIIEFLKTYK